VLVGFVASVSSIGICFGSPYTAAVDENTILSTDSTVIAISHRYYEGITEKYDYVLEIRNGEVNQYNPEEYFQEEAI